MHVEQQATAAGASVVIQVGRDLYVSDAGLSSLWTPGATTPGECPFPGLGAFGPAQSGWFFGRERLTGELLQMLDEGLRTGSGEPLLLVGPSGAGKSSLLGAGLLAAVADGRLPAPGSHSWPRIMFTPGSHPARTLREALAACVQARDGTSAGDAAAAPVVVVVDQLEEVFTACPDEAERSAFLAALADLAAGPAVVVLALRAGFYERATGYPVLRAAMRHRQVVVGAMTPDEIRTAITKPARAVGLSLESRLDERLLRDLGVEEAGGYEAGRLPLLAHALRSTWQRRDGDRLTIAGYEAAGGIGGGIAKTAEDVCQRFDEAGQRAARRLFLALVRIGETDDAEGEGTVDTRRRVSAESLYAQATDPDATAAVLNAFTAARLLTSGGQAVQITHEVLMRRWPRLRDWIGEDRAGNLVRQGLEEAATAWELEGRDSSALFGGVRLAAAQAWAAGSPRVSELSPAARDFLIASDRRRRRGIRRRNGLIAALAALALVLGGLTGYSIVQRDAAVNESNQAESAVLSVASTAELAASHPDIAAQFAALAERLEPASLPAAGAVLATQTQPIVGRLYTDGASADAGARGHVLGVAYSPDGAVIATSTNMGNVQLWSASDYRQLAALRLGDLTVYAVAFSPDGRVLAAGLKGGVRLWNVADPAHPVSIGMIRTDPGQNAATAIAFSPDGRSLAVADSAGTVELWSTGNRRLEASAFVAPLSYLGFAERGSVVAIDSVAGPIGLWNPATGAVTVVSLTGAVPGALAVSPNGQTLAFSTSRGGTITLWSLSAHRVTATLTGIPNSVNPASLVFSPDGSLVAAGCSDAAVRVWYPQAGSQPQAPLATLAGNRYSVNDVAFSPDGTTLASAADDGTVALWHTPDSALGDDPVPSGNLAFTADGRLIAIDVSYPDGVRGVALYSMPSGRRVALLSTGTSLVTALAISGNGQVLAAALTGSPTGTVRLWNLATGRATGQIVTGQQEVLSLALNRDGRLLAISARLNASVRLWDTSTLSPFATLNTAVGNPALLPVYGTTAMAFSPDGRLLAVADEDGVALLYSATRQSALVGIYRNAPAEDTSLAFSPDGSRLAVGEFSGTVLVYTVKPTPSSGTTGPFPASEMSFSDSNQAIEGLAFEPGGSLFAAGLDGTIRLLDLNTQTLAVSINTGSAIYGMAYSPLGFLATLDNGMTSIWQTNAGQIAADICQTLQAPVSRTAWGDYLSAFPYNPIC
jgi:WD40 repeat protein